MTSLRMTTLTGLPDQPGGDEVNAEYVAGVDDVLEMLSKIKTQDLKWEITKLRAIRAWALEHLGVNYAAGDRVRIKTDLSIRPDSGWRPYVEALGVGATGVVQRIEFNACHHYWYADVILDREWSYSDFDGGSRYWVGPVAETPEGYKAPSKYNQEHYPEGRRHTFGISVEKLELALIDGKDAR